MDACPDAGGGGGGNAPSLHGSILSDHFGFDIASAPTSDQMSAWWSDTSAPSLYTVGIYIAGGDRSDTTQANLTPGWMTTVSGQGWSFLPINVAYEAPSCVGSPCSGPTNCTSDTAHPTHNPFELPSDTVTASQDGKAAADDGVAQAANLGILGGSPIYIDIEDYKADGTYQGVSCRAIVNSFVQGYTQEMANTAYKSGVYSNPTHLADYAGLNNPPNDVWIANWDSQKTTWGQGLAGLSDSLWIWDQRHKQYQGDTSETKGGVMLFVDNDCSNGDVSAVNNYAQAEGSDDEQSGSTAEDPSC